MIKKIKRLFTRWVQLNKYVEAQDTMFVYYIKIKSLKRYLYIKYNGLVSIKTFVKKITNEDMEDILNSKYLKYGEDYYFMGIDADRR